MRVTTDQGRSYSGTAAWIVRQMNRDSWMRSNSKMEYMADVADRVLVQTGDRIRSDCAEHFLADLAAAGLITIDEEGGLLAVVG